jgi:CRP/FNR family cyclic AMP-dependent transcriptional regulator
MGVGMRSRIPRQHIEMLGQVPLFSGCTQPQLRALAQLGTHITAEAGHVLTQQGKPGSEFFLVLSGTASVKKSKREIDQLKAGDYFGELAILHGGIRNASVTAATDMELLVLDAREFRSVLMTTPTIGVKMLALLAERLEEADARASN